MNDKIFASALACFFLLPGTTLFAQELVTVYGLFCGLAHPMKNWTCQ
jgi:hypothetical protein